MAGVIVERGLIGNLWMLVEILVVLGVIVYCVIWYISSGYDSACERIAPDNYTYTGNILGKCNYETKKDLEYDTCFIKLEDTKNHGKIETDNSCKLNRIVGGDW